MMSLYTGSGMERIVAHRTSVVELAEQHYRILLYVTGYRIRQDKRGYCPVSIGCPSGEHRKPDADDYICWESDMPDELVALAWAVNDQKSKGPWRQLVDWMMTHAEDMPEDFRAGFECFLAEAFP